MTSGMYCDVNGRAAPRAAAMAKERAAVMKAGISDTLVGAGIGLGSIRSARIALNGSDDISGCFSWSPENLTIN